MNRKTNPDLGKIFLLPTSENLVKAGIILYLLGLTCTFFYFAHFNILSIDFLKPNAIIIGIYVWAYYIFIPRLLILFLAKINQVTNGLKKITNLSSFFFLCIISNLIILFSLTNQIVLATIYSSTLLSTITLLFHVNFITLVLEITPSLFKTYLFIILFCFLFSFFLFPEIPHEFGGAAKVKVNVTLSDKSLLESSYSKSIYLIYESDKEYYFIENKADASNGLVFEYIIKKINKTEIKKIEFTKSIWQPF